MLKHLNSEERRTLANRSALNVAGAELVGKAFAERVVAAKIADNCYFDRGGYRYHGRVKALCEAIRAGGVRI